MELLSEGDGHFDDDGDVGIAEYDGVCDGRKEDTRITHQSERAEYVTDCDGAGVDAAWVEASEPAVVCSSISDLLGGFGAGIQRFFAEKEVRH